MSGMSGGTESDVIVRKFIVVNASQSHAFNVFVEHHGEWWPLDRYHIGSAPAETAVIEPRVGGRWFERGRDGRECDWGRVLVWEPPNRIVLSWDITANWQFDRNLGTEVEVRFLATGQNTTRLELEHRLLDRYGEHAERMRSTFESDSGWGAILQRYAVRVA